MPLSQETIVAAQLLIVAAQSGVLTHPYLAQQGDVVKL